MCLSQERRRERARERERERERRRAAQGGREKGEDKALYSCGAISASLSVPLCLSSMRKGSKLSLRKQAAAAAATKAPLRSPLNPVNTAATAQGKEVETETERQRGTHQKETVRQRETLGDRDAQAEEPIAPA
eukprot:COSAG03_NODE_2833_length_2423_cov_2.014200_3_plen_132_part_01